MTSTQPAPQKAKFDICGRKLQKVIYKTFHRKTYFT